MSNLNDRISKIVEESGLSKTDFGKKINVSQQYVSKLVREGTPSDRTIKDICHGFNIDEAWLLTGDGEMHPECPRKDAIADFAASVMKGEADSFRQRFVEMLASLDADDWAVLEKMAKKMQKKS